MFIRPLHVACMFVYVYLCVPERDRPREHACQRVHRFMLIIVLTQGQLGKVQGDKVQPSKHRQPFPSILSRSEMRGRTELES